MKRILKYGSHELFLKIIVNCVHLLFQAEDLTVITNLVQPIGMCVYDNMLSKRKSVFELVQSCFLQK